MKRNPVFFTVLLLFALRLPAAHSQDADAEAKRGLTLLQQYVTDKNYKDFGLTSTQEISQLHVLEGVDVFYVLNDDLKKFHSGASLAELVRPSETRFYPVLLREQGKFLITVRFREGKWRFASFEETDDAANLVRLINGSKFVDKDSKLYAIEVPALHLSYATMSKPSPGKHMSLLAVNQISFEAVRPDQNPNTYLAATSGVLDAEEVFGVLSQKAQKIATPRKR